MSGKRIIDGPNDVIAYLKGDESAAHVETRLVVWCADCEICRDVRPDEAQNPPGWTSDENGKPICAECSRPLAGGERGGGT